MALIDVLQQILNSAKAPEPAQIDQITREATPDELKSSVGEALRSKQTPQLSQIVADMFERASPQDRADILNTLVEKLGPGALAGVAGGALAGHEGADAPRVTVEKATQISPAQVRDVVTTARTADEPGVFERVSDFYARHPDLVKTLGAGALMIALARMKNNMMR
jgi:hypothetical protein